MPPKVKISKEDILNKAVDMVRQKGIESINARALAKELECSTQPIFSNYKNMDELYADIICKANGIYEGFVEKQREKYPPYKAHGMGYVCFAKEEKELFKLLYMRNRSGEYQGDKELMPIYEMLVSLLGISLENARLFHLESWVFVHGIASITASDYLDLDIELISSMITDNFEGLKHRFGVDK
ncbi:MAG: TetR/AcrR family transcriptional regulator [Clostridia bacterium]|nr:TetR/AcrR family transcriptional regulator [Clostridia bacterium]